MRLIIIFAFLVFSISAQSQDYSKSPIVSKVTATWCPNCGSWGWDYMEALKEEFEDGTALLLGVHHSGNLENPVSDWLSKNLKNSYQPQFFVNNQQLSVGSGNWPSKVEEMRNRVDAVRNEMANSAFNFNNAFVNGNNEIEVSLNVEPLNKSEGDYYIGIYIYENNVIESQSQQGANAMHPNVLRDVMSDNFWGDSFMMGTTNISKSYSLDNVDWNQDNLGVVAIMWEKVGDDYVVDNTRFTNSLDLLSSTNDDLEITDLTILTYPDRMNIQSLSGVKYQINILDNSGKMIFQDQFSGSFEKEFSNIPTGLYHLLVYNQNGKTQKTFFIK